MLSSWRASVLKKSSKIAINLFVRQKVRTRSLHCFLLILLSGCAAPITYTWVKPGSTTQEFNSVNYECLKASQQREAYSNLSYNALFGGYQGGSGNTVNTNSQLFNACMNAKGWTLQGQQAQRSVTQSIAPAASTRECSSARNDAEFNACKRGY